MGLQIYGNIDAGSLLTGKVQSVNNLVATGIKNLVAGDGLEVELFLTSQTGFVNIQDYSVRLGIGDLNARPTGGTFDLGSTTGLDYNLSASDLQTAIASEASANTTTLLSPFVFKTVFTANGSQTIPSIDATGLTPSSTVSITKLVEGDGSTQEQWLTRIFANPLSFQDTWTNFTKTGVGEGLSGILGLGTPEIYSQFSESVTSFTSTLEMEITDTNGNTITIFQIPVTIGGESIGAGITVSSITPSNFVTATDVNTSIDSATTIDKSIYISQSRGNDATGTRNSTTKPYLTFAGGLADAQSGDTIVLLDGDFSSESASTINLGTLTINIGHNVKCCGFTTGVAVTKFNVYGQQDAQIDGTITINSSCYVRGISLNNLITNCYGTLFFENCDFRGTAGSTNTIQTTVLSPVAGTITFKECTIRSNGSVHTIHHNDNVAQLYVTNCRVQGSSDNTIQIDTTTSNFPTGIYVNNSLIEATGSYAIDSSATPSGINPQLYFNGGISQLGTALDSTSWGTVQGNFYVGTNFPSLSTNLAP